MVESSKMSGKKVSLHCKCIKILKSSSSLILINIIFNENDDDDDDDDDDNFITIPCFRDDLLRLLLTSFGSRDNLIFFCPGLDPSSSNTEH